MKWFVIFLAGCLAVFALPASLLAKKKDDEAPAAPDAPLSLAGGAFVKNAFQKASSFIPYAPVPEIKVVPVVKNQAVYGPDASGQPRGVRNNNPGNVRASNTKWEGQTGKDDKDFVIFDPARPDVGFRCMTVVLGRYFQKGNNTVKGIIAVYAPATDSNDVSTYAAVVANALDVAPDDELDFNTHSYGLMLAMVNVEQGKAATKWWAVADIGKGYTEGREHLGI